MSEGYTKRYVSSGGFRNEEDGAPATPIDKATLNAMDEGIRTANLRDESAATPSLRTLGTSATQAASGADTRLLSSKGVVASRPDPEDATWYFATDVNGGTLQWSDGAVWTNMAPGIAQAGSGGDTVVGSTDGQIATYDAVEGSFIIDYIRARNVAADADIPPSAIAGTAVVDDDPRLGGTTPGPSREEEIRNGTASIRESIRRPNIGVVIPLTYGRVAFAGVPVFAGDVFSAIACLLDTTGAGAPAGWYLGLWDNTFTKLKNTADQGTSIPTDEAPVQINLTSNTAPVPADTMYYVGILNKSGGAGTPFGIYGKDLLSPAASAPIATGQARIAGHGQTGQSAPPTNLNQNNDRYLPYFALVKV